MSERVTDAAAGAKLPPDAARVSLDGGARIPERYDRLLAALARAEKELGLDDGARRSAALEEASSLVFDLLYALDFRQGGEMVPRLAALYGYIGNELLNIGRTGDKLQLAHLRDMIATLRRSWGGTDTAE